MQELLFYFFSLLTVVCAGLVVYNPISRSPVTSAMFLVLAMAGLAGLFVSLHAFFLAAVQIIIYAGAVVVLFLFVIMLLNPEGETRRPLRWGSFGLTLAGLAVLGIAVIRRLDGGSVLASADGGGELVGSTAVLGRSLFSTYLLPFEVVSVLLLVAMVGVVVLSKKDLK